ncbi:MAG: efflux RND transporter periplasmic adaptor subunit [Bacteroidales bacterium]
MKKVTTGVVSIALIASVVLIGLNNNQSKDKKSNKKGKNKTTAMVDAYVVKPVSLLNEITVSGSLLPFEAVELKSETAGRVVKLNLPEGKKVKAGTLLVKLYDDDLQAGLKKLESQLALQKQIYKRQSELLKINGISQNDFDQTMLQVNALSAEIEVHKVLIRKTEVRAPFDGVIGLRNISLGAQITSVTSLATIRQEDKIKLDFSVPEKYGSVMKPGLDLKFTLYNSDKVYEASVIASECEIEQSTRSMKVRAVVKSRGTDLIPGAFAHVQLTLGENKSALMIPSQALIPQERNKSVILVKNGTAHFVKVKTGNRKVSNVEIIEGIQAGDTVVTSGILFLKEGDLIRFSNLKTGAL